jgi:hypothetical protein
MSSLSHIGNASDGEARRNAALANLRVHRAVIIRRIQRAFVRHLLDVGPATADAARVVPIPAGIDARLVGAAVRGLSADDRIITVAGREKSRRPEAHARTLDVWAVRSAADAEHWLLTHPELPEPTETTETGTADAADPFAAL